MTKLTRIRIMFTRLLTIFFALIMILFPELGAPLITLVISVVLIVKGIHDLIYYATMARYMVNGQLILCKGLLFLNTGLFILDLTDIPLHYIMIYLLAGHGFTGAMMLLRALESRRMGVGSWRIGFFVGLGNIGISVLCLVFINNANIMVYIYSLSLIASAVADMIGATKKTAMVYIQ